MNQLRDAFGGNVLYWPCWMYAIKYFLVIPVRAYIVRTYRQLNTPGCGSGANGIAVRTILVLLVLLVCVLGMRAYGQTIIE